MQRRKMRFMKEMALTLKSYRNLIKKEAVANYLAKFK